jgi:hypothetical protein
VERPREAEVENLGSPARRDHQVRGLQVAVDDSQGVRRDQDADDLFGEAHLRGAVEALADRLPERLSVDQLENEEVALRRLEVVVDLTDVRVFQLREDAGLAQESRPSTRVEVRLPDGFQCHPPLQLFVVAEVDGPHSASPDKTDDAQVPEPAPDEVVFVHGSCSILLPGAGSCNRTPSAREELTEAPFPEGARYPVAPLEGADAPNRSPRLAPQQPRIRRSPDR